jgi:hypothetical protein
MNSRYRLLLGIVLTLYVIYHFATLVYSPLPWFDEITFLSMTESYIKDKTFYETCRILVIPDEKLVYGPLFFILQAFIIKSLGFSIFTVRLSSLVFGIINLALIYKICRHFKFGYAATFIAIAIVAFEPNFNQFLHSGRNDFVTLFFFLISYLVYINTDSRSHTKTIIFGLFTGIMLACAALTTPRIIFAFSFYVFALIYEIAADKSKTLLHTIIKYCCIAAGFISIYSIWVYSAFDSFKAFIDYNLNSPVIQAHTGVESAFRPSYYLFVFIYAFIALIVSLRNKALSQNRELLLFTVPIVVSFILIVTGGLTGRYFALADTFLAIMIAGLTIHLHNGKIMKYATYTLILFYVGIFMVKAVYIAANASLRNPYTNEAIITQYIKPNNAIVADFQYYYIARNKNCTFLSIDENGMMDKKLEYIYKNKFRYFIVNKNNWAADFYHTEVLKNNYKLIANIDIKNNTSGLFQRVLKKLPYKISESYSCRIYEYKGE